MVVSENKVVSLQYQLKLDNENGEVVETVSADRPLQFLFGAGRLLTSFEDQIDGLKAEDNFQFTLTPENAYGAIDPNAIVDLPKTIFMVDGNVREDLLQIGKNIPMRDSNGNNMNGVVVEIADETVKMDFNHPMAGRTLHFAGSITDIREATEIEQENGMLESEMKSGGCGDSCGCGSAEESCESSGGGCGDSCGCN